MGIDNLSIQTRDGVTLGAGLYTPAQSNGRVVLINAAMGVKRGYYHKFAAFLMDQGFTVLTYDYRGIGESLTGTVRHSPAELWEWGVKDYAAVVEWLQQRYPDQKLLVVAHSVGGQILGLTPASQHLTAALLVACQSGYWQLWPGLLKARMFVIWHLLIPGLTRLLGYFPSQRVGMGEDLPAGIALHWARAGRQPRYIRDTYQAYDHFSELTIPMYFYSIEDDWYAPRPTVEGLVKFYSRARSTHEYLRPAALGVKAIGHFGFFREKFKDTLWQQTAAWLCEQ